MEDNTRPQVAGESGRPAGAPAIADVVAKVVQECQNGLASRVLLSPGPAGGDRAGVDALCDEVAGYAARIGAPATRRRSGVDIRVPRASVTVEFFDSALVVAGHRQGTARLPPEHLAPPAAAGNRTGTGTGTALRRGGGDGGEAGDGIWDLASRIVGRTGRATGGGFPAVPLALEPADRVALRDLLRSESWLLATLAADTLNRAGEPAVPRFVRDHDPSLVTGVQPSDGTFTQAWESRISVDEYALFEAVHPAYASQVVALAEMARRHAVEEPDRIVDVGSGPGLPTIMVSELLPDAVIDAVEPSPAAFRHLLWNVSARKVAPYNRAIEDFHRSEPYPLAISVGASHHLDTRVFLRSMLRLVRPGGLALVADEMISPFETEEDRTRNLIDHHVAYIGEALAHVTVDGLPAVERRRLLAFRSADSTSPVALRRLLHEARKDRVPHAGDASPWQRVRFAVLELEALVAGVDYDVERKTYPENFMAMAHDEGFEVVEHRRVHPTVGGSALDAGTHVYALRRPSGSP